MKQESIGIIGLGLMGSAISQRLIAASYPVLGFDIDSTRCSVLSNLKGEIAENPAQIASHCKRIILSLPTTDVVEKIIVQIQSVFNNQHIIIDTTTGNPRQTAALGTRLFDQQVNYLDATISGSSAQTAMGEVIVLSGGQLEAFNSCEDLFQCFARKWFHLGEWGNGARMKLISNLALGLNRAALAETLGFAYQEGFSPETVLAILKESPAYSVVMDTKGQKMIAGDFTAQARLSQHLKDVRIILKEGKRSGARLPLSELHCNLLEELEADGFGQEDNSAIIRAFSVKK